MSNWLADTLTMQMLGPVALFAALFAATFVLEDVATVAAGLLAGQMAIDPVAAGVAVVAGTLAGDIALYAVGRWLGDTALARRLRARSNGRGEALIRKRGLIAVAIARVVPGTRLPVFFGSGVVQLAAIPVILTLAATTLAWTPAIFWASHAAGSMMGPAFSPAFIAVAAALIGAMLLLPRLIARIRASNG